MHLLFLQLKDITPGFPISAGPGLEGSRDGDIIIPLPVVAVSPDGTTIEGAPPYFRQMLTLR